MVEAGSVSRIDTHMISQRKYLFLYPSDQSIVIAARKVSAANGTAEQGYPR